jgi:hypothetical protein
MQRMTDPRFMAIANTGDTIGALAAAFFASFGVSLIDIEAAVEKMAKDDLKELAIQCITAGMQIRANSTFVKAKGMSDVPIFTISSQRPGITDQVNFKALHMAGHMLAALAGSNEWAQKMNARGNCIRGGDFPDSTAGKINREIYDGISPEEKMSFNDWLKTPAGVQASAWAVECFVRLQDEKTKLAATKTSKKAPARPSASATTAASTSVAE